MRAAALLCLTCLAMLLAGVPPLRAAEPVIPRFFDTREQIARPDVTEVTRIRFLTTVDFPPFNFIDPSGRLSGFHIDLARAICRELAIMERCQIQALPWNELQAALERGEGEALLAGIAVTAENRRLYAFSRPYLQFPARFAMRKADAASEPLHVALTGKRVGVVRGSAHETYLRAFFPRLQPVVYDRESWMLDDLRDAKVAAAFGDGMRLGFWLAGSTAQDCCAFAGGPYLAQDYFGEGLAIAVPADRPELAAMFDYALQQITAKSVFAELYLRYFPVSFF